METHKEEGEIGPFGIGQFQIIMDLEWTQEEEEEADNCVTEVFLPWDLIHSERISSNSKGIKSEL